MDPTWQVFIGSAIGGLLITIYGIYKSFSEDSKRDNESQTMAKWSIFFGLSGIILVGIGSIVGLILGLRSMKNKKHKALSNIGIILSILTMLPWIAVLIFEP